MLVSLHVHKTLMQFRQGGPPFRPCFRSVGYFRAQSQKEEEHHTLAGGRGDVLVMLWWAHTTTFL